MVFPQTVHIELIHTMLQLANANHTNIMPQSIPRSGHSGVSAVDEWFLSLYWLTRSLQKQTIPPSFSLTQKTFLRVLLLKY